jgi:sialate O-acetylesterase
MRDTKEREGTMTASTKRLASLALAGALSLGLAGTLAAKVRLPAVIGDHMVVQQGESFTVWGWAAKGELVWVRFGLIEDSTYPGADGKWRVTFTPPPPGGPPLEIVVRGAASPEIVVRDVLVGEVWLCSGQSNMEWAMSWLPNPAPDIMRADNPNMRLFRVPKRTSDRPLDDVDARWELCTPDSVRPFSAVAYYFGLELHKRLGIPVGLIESAWGGTMIEPWTPPAGFAAVSELKPILDGQAEKYAGFRDELAKALPVWEKWVRESRKALAAKAPIPPEPAMGFPANPYETPQAPTALYNAMIHPLTPFPIRGAIWYQGESNRNDGPLYRKKMEALIEGWRMAWKMSDFPFYYVQLAPYNYAYNRETPTGDVPDFLRLPLIWEAQADALTIPNTGMAVVTDIADLDDIHPANKRDVGCRLSLWARAKTYGEKTLVHSGPLYKEMTIEKNLARLSFDHVGGGLVSNDGQPLKWFEIAGEDRVFYKAEAEVTGDTVVVWSPRVEAPKAVRFGWHQLAEPNLANREGLPASPFRTDRR